MEVTPRNGNREERVIGLVCLLSCLSYVLSAGNYYSLMFCATVLASYYYEKYLR
jgi:hypothetical protein